MPFLQGYRVGEEIMDREVSRDEYEKAIFQWVIGRNGERDRIIISMYLFDGVTYETMQRRLDNEGYELSIDQIKNIIKKRREQVFRHL